MVPEHILDTPDVSALRHSDTVLLVLSQLIMDSVHCVSCPWYPEIFAQFEKMTKSVANKDGVQGQI